MNKAASTIVTPDDNITATNVQAALEELDDIKVQATNGTLSSPTITGTATFCYSNIYKFDYYRKCRCWFK